uniref:Aminotransferase-like plant mobile domain-containing protein n=1 Tax=Fagus sylvatica TaxID=28930 RepID=A0A2N9JB63_FAGSY
MVSSSSIPPVSPAPQPTTGKGSGIPVAVSAPSTEAVVDASAVRPSVLRLRFPPGGPMREIQPIPIDFDFPCAASKDWSCNMFRDTEPLREMLKEHSFSSIELSAEEEEIAAALRRQSSTRLSGWPSLFMHHKEALVRRAAFVLYCLLLQTFFWEHSVSYLFVAKDKVAAWSKFSDLPQEFLDRFPDFRNNLPLVYCWVGLKTHDHDLVTTLDYEENVLFKPYGDDYPGFTCVSVFSRFYQPTSLIRDLRADDHRSLAYLSIVSPGDRDCVPDLAPFIKSRAFARWKDEISRIMVLSGHRFGFNTSSMNAYWQRLTQSMVEFLGFAEWDEIKGGWIAYTIHLPQGWRSSVNVMEDRLIMPSKRGKGSKRDALVDQAVEKAPKKPAPSPKKTPPKKTKAGKKGKSTTSVSASEKKSTTAPKEKPIESTVAPFKAKSVGASLSTKKPSKKSVASRPLKGQKKASVTSSPPDEEQPSAASTPPPSKKKKFTAPLFPLGAASRTRSKSGSKATHRPGRPSGGVVIVEDSNMAVDDIVISSLGRDDLQTAVVDQDKDLGTSVADSPEADAESMEGGHSTSSDSFFDTTPGSMPEGQMMSAGSTADDLAIVPHASHLFEHGHDGDDAADPDTVPLSISVPQTVLTSRITSSDASTAYVMEEISLFGATPRLSAILADGFIISASRLSESESAMDLGIIPETGSKVNSAADHGAQAEGTSAPVADMPVDSEHLDNIGTGETMRPPEEDENMGITGEVTIASLPLRPPAGRLTTGHGNFVSNFKLSVGLGGPMLSLLCSVLAAMSRSNLGNTAQCLFGKKIADEVQALQLQIALLQDSLAVLTAYQGEMTSTGEMALGFESDRSLFDSLFS